MAILNNAINAGLPISAANGGLGLSSPTAHGILIGEGSSPVTPLVLTNGQLLIGSTGSDPVAASLTAGSGIIITPAAGGITIAASGSGFTWTSVTGASATLASNNGYFANNAGVVTFALPAVAAVGDTYQIENSQAGWTVSQGAGQNIRIGNLTTTTGAGGSISSTALGDWITIVCNVTNTGFVAKVEQGNISII